MKCTLVAMLSFRKQLDERVAVDGQPLEVAGE